MRGKLLFFIGLFLVFTLKALPQEDENVPVLSDNDLPGAIIENVRTFAGESLYGYMDGGADLYLEYRLTEARICDVQLNGCKYLVEIFRMQEPDDAFGIFSVSKYQCIANPAFSRYTCHTKYQLQIAEGQFYINIVNSSGKSADSANAIAIGTKLVTKIKGPAADIGSYLQGIPIETLNHEAVLVKGALGLMNGAADMADFFGDATGYSALIMKQPHTTLVSVKFDSAKELEAFAAMRFPVSGKQVATPAGYSVEEIINLADNHIVLKIRQ